MFCVMFCKKCEAENVLIVGHIWAEVVLLECKVSLTVCYFKFLVCKQSSKTVSEVIIQFSSLPIVQSVKRPQKIATAKIPCDSCKEPNSICDRNGEKTLGETKLSRGASSPLARWNQHSVAGCNTGHLWPSMMTHTRNLCSAFNSSKCTHLNTPRAEGHIVAPPGKQLGVRYLAQGSHLSRGIKGGRERWLFTPHQQFLPVQILEPTTFRLQVQLSNHWATTAPRELVWFPWSCVDGRRGLWKGSVSGAHLFVLVSTDIQCCRGHL